MITRCKKCKLEITDCVNEGWKSSVMNDLGYFFICTEGSSAEHHPMDNLDYIEYLAKEKRLV